MLQFFIYNLIFICLLPIFVLRLFVKAKNNQNYIKNLSQRFAFNLPKTQKPLVIHAVSVGEMILTEILLTRWQNDEILKNEEILLTCTTPTGKDFALKMQQKFTNLKINISFLPYDFVLFVLLFLYKVKPKMFIFIETEIWFSYLFLAQKFNIKTLLLNARLSEKSFKNYQKFNFFSKAMLQNLSFIATQNKESEERFLSINQNINIINTGSMKFDIQADIKQIQELAKQIINNDNKKQVIVAASTHKGEESIILDSFQQLLTKNKNLLLILVPRHLERFEEVYQLTKERFITARRSQNDINQTTEVLIGDSLGELLSYYYLADIAIVGGSFVKVGGHNILEPIYLQKCVIVGEYMFNFQSIFNELLENYAISTTNSNNLSTILEELLTNKEKRLSIIQNANHFLEQHKGVTSKNIALIKQQLQ